MRRKSYKLRSRVNKRTRKIHGGHLCTESIGEGQSNYTKGAELGVGEEAIVYLAEGDNTKVIKEFHEILHFKRSISNLVDYTRIFKVSEELGKAGIGPNVHFFTICKKVLTTDLAKMSSIELQRFSAKFPFGSKDLNELRILKNQLLRANATILPPPPPASAHIPPPSPLNTTFTYKAFVPYLVMDKIDGHDITLEEIANTDIMAKVFDKYQTMVKKGYNYVDLHRGNIMVTNGSEPEVYFIDFSSARKIEDGISDVYTNTEELKEAILNPLY